jgi:hypothetical protein
VPELELFGRVTDLGSQSVAVAETGHLWTDILPFAVFVVLVHSSVRLELKLGFEFAFGQVTVIQV